MSELAQFLRSSVSYSFGMPVVIDYSIPDGSFWSTVFNADAALRDVVTPLLKVATSVRVFKYEWVSEPSDEQAADVRRRIDSALVLQKNGKLFLDLDRDLVTGWSRFWFGGVPRMMSVVPLVVVPVRELVSIEVPLTHCAAEGSSSGSNSGLFSAAVRAAKEHARKDYLGFVFRGEELELYYPRSDATTDPLAQIIDRACVPSRELRSMLRSIVKQELDARRSAGEVI